ncbi:gamma carbonic anhydrase family protein [Salicibibacter halophilus]|uniref:Gamma carbonic anhydrase family protein n=1 Tax=Salicibibacter halophilus TaxID=2502791 RepID=A0A514LMJ6_9BACI|nr:gamma carbonic anhydrase family protein [Salicibibacter halophilus]QDI93066.1 gamma carbonic anhydrase family protein [Salicibibacter halophilus]
MIYPYDNTHPEIAKSCYIADGVVVTGDVSIGDDSSIWFHTVIRGDVAPTEIGDRVNIQDQCMLHQSPAQPLTIEDDVSIGHQVVVHGCTIRKKALIGMKATVLDGAEVGEEAFVAAGALVTPGTNIPPRTLAMGSPARVVRDLNAEDLEEMKRVREAYVERGKTYAKAKRQT